MMSSFSSFVLHDNFFLYKSILCLIVLVLIGHDFRIYSMCLDCRFVEFSLTIYCALEKGLEKHSESYFSDCTTSTSSADGRDEGQAKELWELVEQITDTKFPLQRPLYHASTVHSWKLPYTYTSIKKSCYTVIFLCVLILCGVNLLCTMT